MRVEGMTNTWLTKNEVKETKKYEDLTPTCEESQQTRFGVQLPVLSIIPISM